MRTLTPAERRTCRAAAHHLRPVVSVGHHGLTPAVLHEIDVALTAHELVKIRVFGDDRAERDALHARICGELDAAPVQHLGKILTVWRPAPEPVAPVARPRAHREAGAGKPRRAPPRGTAKRSDVAAAAWRAKKPRQRTSRAPPQYDERRSGGTPAAPRAASRPSAPIGTTARRRPPPTGGKPAGKRGGATAPVGVRIRATGPAAGARRRRTPR